MRPFRVHAVAVLVASAGLAGLSGCRESEGPPTGRALYLRYCASCHGMTGDGRGPIADSLRRPPSDLRRIAQRAGGHFDERAVMSFIDGERLVAEHGPREMPVWGMVFEQELEDRRSPAYISLLQSRALTDYLRSLQEP